LFQFDCSKRYRKLTPCMSGFAKGYAFRRAVKRKQDPGFSRWGILQQGLKANQSVRALAARLEAVPFQCGG